MNKHHSGSEWELKWWFVDWRNGVIGQKWKNSGPEKWGWIGEKWDRSEKRKKKAHRERRLNRSLDREGIGAIFGIRLEWIGACFVSGVEWIGAWIVSRSELGSEWIRVIFVECVELGSWADRSLAVSSLDRGASVWVVPFGSVCGSEQWRLDRGSACVRDSCVWERGGKDLKWK